MLACWHAGIIVISDVSKDLVVPGSIPATEVVSSFYKSVKFGLSFFNLCPHGNIIESLLRMLAALVRLNVDKGTKTLINDHPMDLLSSPTRPC